MVEAEAAARSIFVPPAGKVGVVSGPLGWGVVRRLAWAAAACAVLWLAVVWALS
jgi:hypothetical protein